MELATVKAKVKTWEKTFRATHGRAPTKDDIKRDASDIAELYATYRRLSKQGGDKATLSSMPPNTTTHRSPLAATRNTAAATAPATPTPHARRRKEAVSVRIVEPVAESGPSRSAPPITPQKRPALFMTPQKPKPSASGQLPHASPNPFSVTPRKKANGESSAGPIFETSPFIHNSSPKKYKEVLDAYSRARGAGPGSVEITPRTKARKRLAGELEATPAKVPRRQRRDRPTATGTAAAAPPPPPPPVRRAGSDWEDEYDDDDEEFGETPAKPGVPAFGLDAGLASGTKSKPKGLLPLFQSVKRAAEEAGGRDAKRRAVNGAKAELEYDFDAEAPEAPGSPSPRVSPNANRLPTPPPYSPPPIERTQQQQPKSRTQTRTRVVKFSGNEWDPAADTRSVCVRGTRRAAIRVAPDAGLASDDEESAAEEKEAEAAEDIGEDEDEEDEEDNADGARDAAPLMSFLSLRSPIARKGERLADLRVRALLDPTSAAAVALRAARRGQEVFVCGEVDGEGDEWELDVDVAAAEGDDDWESDPEGWKAAPDDDDW